MHERKTTRGLARRILILTAACVTSILSSCRQELLLDGEVDVNVGKQPTGMIQGRITVATVANNTVVWTPYAGANVEIQGTGFSTTSLQAGIYAIDGIPTGSYDVRASTPSGAGYFPGVRSVVVVAQNTSTVPDHQLEPCLILHGKVYWQDSVSPFGNRTVTLQVAAFNTSTNQYVPGTVRSSTVTNPDGGFAFRTSPNNLMLTTPGLAIWFMNPDSPVKGNGAECGIVRRDARIR